MNNQISFFDQKVTIKEPARAINFDELINHIKTGFFRDKIEKGRNFLYEFRDQLQSEDEATRKKTKRTYQQLKSNLPSYTISGKFSTLDTAIPLEKKLLAHSGFICLDIDDIITIDQEGGSMILDIEKERYSALEFVYIIFISPSGTGLKVICKLDPAYANIEGHPVAFEALLEALKELKIEERYFKGIEQCRDITRRCFTSYDPDIYVNEKCGLFSPKGVTPSIKEEPAPKAPSKPTSGPDLLKCNRLANTLVEKKIDITKSYDDWVSIALSLSNLGESGREIFHKVSSVNPGYDPAEADKKYTHCLKTGFSNTEAGKGVSLGTFIKIANDAIKAATPAQPPRDPESEYKTSHLIDHMEELIDEVAVGDPKDPTCGYVQWIGNFWIKTRKVKEKTGEIVYTWNMDYVKFRRFLERAGFFKLVTKYKNKANTFEYVKVENKVIKSVRAEDIENYVMEWVRNYELDEVENKLTQGSSRYFSEHTLRKLSVRAFDFKRDTREEAFYYFRNCYVRVTAKGVESKPLSDLDGYIWYSQIIDKDFSYTADNDNSVFNRFLNFATNGRRLSVNGKMEISLDTGDIAEKRISAVMTGIGYAMHGFKDPTKAKSFDIFDAKISRDKRPEGRSGKSLTFKAIGQVIPTVEIDATNIKLNDNLTLSEVSHDTRFIYFNDANESFPFIRLFHMLTENMTSKRLYLDPIIIPFETSPKIGVNTNWVLKGEGGSYRARQHNVEFTDFFTPEYSPRDHFNCQFFSSDWNEEEWSLFYSSMFDYVSFYFETGLVQFPEPNFEYRKLLAAVPEEFVLWFNDELKKEVMHEKKALYEQFKNGFSDFETIKQNTFTRWLQRCCDHFGYSLNKGHENGRHRANGIDYITITPQN